MSIAVAIVLAIPGVVKAQDLLADAPVQRSNDAPSIRLSLDEGFVGRPVSLDLFDGKVNISWNAETLIEPSALTVSLVRGTTSSDDQVIAAPAVLVSFSDASAVHPDGRFRVTVKALRPPSASEATEATVFSSHASSTMLQGAFRGEHVSFTVSAAADVTVAPVFRDGIMRQGKASWYAYKRCLCAASPDVPKGTRLLVRRADDPSRFVVVTVNDWGPERDKHPDRVVDLDKVAFARIGNPRGGVMAVTVDVLDPADPLWKLGNELPPPNMKKLLAALQALAP